MIRCRVIGKSKPATLLLIHGLFSSAGFWLPYLECFKGYRLLALDIDYRGIGDFERYAVRLRDVIERETFGRVDGVVAHSLGTLLASSLPGHYFMSNFEVCPVYCASRVKSLDFVGEIRRRLRFAPSQAEIVGLLGEVDSAVRAHAEIGRPSRERTVYIPESDPYFSYEYSPKYKYFKGDHFEISAAIKDIEKTLVG